MSEATAAHTATEATMDAANERLNVLAGQLNMAHAALTAEVAELLGNDGWRQGAVRSPAGFLQWKLGLSQTRAADVVHVAERRGEFPVLTAAFDRGEFSLDQMAAAVGAPAWADELVYDFVKIATVAKIRRGMRSNMFEGPRDEPESDVKPVRDRLSFGIGRDGRWRIRGEFGIDGGRRIEAALTERRDALFTDDTDHVGDDDRVEGDGETDTDGGDAGDGQVVTWPEAFLDCMERSLDQVESSSRRDRYRTWLHLDVGSGDATTTDGWRLPMAIRDHLLCDGVVQPVWETNGLPFSIGRAQHIVPDRTRRIVEKRDRGCRVPGCTVERFVEIHHIIHWTDGGPTDTWNLISLCPAHHRMHHAGELGITGNADEFDRIVFSDVRGGPIPGTGTPVPPTESPPAPPVPYDPPLRGRFDWNWIGLGWTHPGRQARPVTDVDAAHPEAA